jgi:hypothetical protein
VVIYYNTVDTGFDLFATSMAYILLERDWNDNSDQSIGFVRSGFMFRISKEGSFPVIVDVVVIFTDIVKSALSTELIVYPTATTIPSMTSLMHSIPSSTANLPRNR